MARPQLIFVDGSFPELAQEMADYVQVGDEVKPLLAKAVSYTHLTLPTKA